MAKDQLERFRAAVDADDDRRRGRPARRRGSPKRATPIGAIDELKTAPRGYPKDHPRIDLLRRKGLMMSEQFGGADVDAHDAGRAKVRETWAGAEPMNAWLDAHVGPSTLPPDGPPERQGAERRSIRRSWRAPA